MAKAYSYIRFSTPEQEKGDSQRRQLDLSTRYAQENGLELDTTLKLKDLGLSAYHKTNLEKGALGAFLSAISDGRVEPGSYLLVESLDRLSRASVDEALTLFLDIVRAGIILVTLSDGMLYSKDSISTNWTQLVVSLAIMARAHEESAMKAKRLSAIWTKKKSEASEKIVTAQIPAWLTIEHGKIVVNEEKAELVREIFRLVRSGYGVQLIERQFNSENIPVIGKSDRWYKSYLLKILHNRSVIGEYQPKTGRGKDRRFDGNTVYGYYPAIITEDEFYATQAALQTRTTKGGRKGEKVANIFSGLCKCGYCGGPVRYVNKNAKTKWQYLVCSNAKSGLGCRHVPWNYHEFQETVLLKLAALDIESVLHDKNANQKREKLIIDRAKLAENRKVLQNLIKLAELTDNIGEIASRISELQSQERTLQLSIQQLEDSSNHPDTGRSHFENFIKLKNQLSEAEEDEKIELRLRISQELKRLLTTLIIYPDGHEPWSYGMKLIGVTPGKEGRFIVAHFNSGEGRVLHGVNTNTTIWPGEMTQEGIESAHIPPYSAHYKKKSSIREN